MLSRRRRGCWSCSASSLPSYPGAPNRRPGRRRPKRVPIAYGRRVGKHNSADVRREAGHPIIDADGHVLEVLEATYPHLREALGARGSSVASARGPRAARRSGRARSTSAGAPARRRVHGGAARRPRTRSTGRRPRCRRCSHERMDEIGIDFAVLYPTNTLLTLAEEDPDLRCGLARGLQRVLRRRVRPVRRPDHGRGHDPDAHARRRRSTSCSTATRSGSRSWCSPRVCCDRSTSPADDDCSPWLYPGPAALVRLLRARQPPRLRPGVGDVRGARLRRRRSTAGLTVRPGLHWSITSYVANHVGQFAAEMYPLVQVAAVRRRDRALPASCRSCFLECGVSWAAQMLADTIEHWEKRNIDAHPAMDPARLDRDELATYFARYGGRIAELIGVDPYEYVQRLPVARQHARGARRVRAPRGEAPGRHRRALRASFYFGCEADDRGVTTAFAPSNPGGAAARARSSRPTSGTGTSPTSRASSPSRTSSSRTASSRPSSGAASRSTTRSRCSRA